MVVDNNKKLTIVMSAIVEYLNAEQSKILKTIEPRKSQPAIKRSSKLNLWKRVI